MITIDGTSVAYTGTVGLSDAEAILFKALFDNRGKNVAVADLITAANIASDGTLYVLISRLRFKCRRLPLHIYNFHKCYRMMVEDDA